MVKGGQWQQTMSKREDNKNDKKQQIIRAAKQLMQAADVKGFSMRTLAEVAGVSIATPYNLFGSKENIVAAVMDTDLDQFKEALLAEPTNPIDTFFRAVTTAVRLFEKEPNYYMTGALAVHSETNEKLTNHFSIPRQELFKDLVVQAIQQGYLAHQVNPESFAINLGYQFYSWIQAWARGHLSLQQLELRTHYSFAASLAAVATAENRDSLTTRMLAIQDQLPEAWEQQKFRTGT